MKKTYIAPKTHILEVETESIIALSNEVGQFVPLGGDENNFGSESRSILWGED